MNSGPLEWCIGIAIIAAICIGIFAAAHIHISVPDREPRRAPRDRAACFQRSASSVNIGALSHSRHPA